MKLYERLRCVPPHKVAGFPNMLTITGPQSPSVLTNMVSAIEHHVGVCNSCCRLAACFAWRISWSPSVYRTETGRLACARAEWMVDCMAWCRANGKRTLEATEEAQAEWTTLNNTIGDMTVWGPACGGANSWYRGANIPGKPTNNVMPWCGGALMYREKLAAVEGNSYEGFVAN